MRRLLAHPRLVFWTLVTLGFALRLWVCGFGYNFDLAAFFQVGRLVSSGKLVYTHSENFNYGYPFALVFGGLFRAAMAIAHAFQAHPGHVFHCLLAATLSAVDVGILLSLRQRVSARAGWLFYFNPISIIITGFHSQFDNAAILLALEGAAWIAASRTLDRRKWTGIGLLGLSLIVKHVCFLLPLWLALRERRWKTAAAVLVGPPALFLLGFAPFWPAAGPQILRNVFLYRSFENGTVPHLLAMLPGVDQLPRVAVFIAAMLICGIALRRRRAYDLTLIYLVAMVTFSSAIANQSLAIPVAGISAFMNPFYAAFTLVSAWFLIALPPGLGVAAVTPTLPAMLNTADPLRRWDPLILLLLAGFVWMLIDRRKVTRF